MKCNRTVCKNEGVYKHKYNKKLYCPSCARAINSACNEEVVLDVSGWEGTFFRDHLAQKENK